MALDSIRSHKLRSGLTLLGILIGVFSIIVVMTVLRVLDDNAASSLSQLGPHTFTVKRSPPFVFRGPSRSNRFWERKEITMKVGERLRERAELPLSVGMEEGFASGVVRSRYAETNPDVNLRGVTPEIFAARSWNIDGGRALTAADVDSARLVCVLGSGLARRVFPNSQAVGDRITFEGLAYRVVGVLESKGQTLDDDQDNFVLVPLTTGLPFRL